MDKTDILFRTARGEQEITTQTNKLPIKHRSVLIMIDGKNSEASLQAKLSGMFDSRAILNDLETHGFITRKAAPKPALKTIESAAQLPNMEAKKYMIDVIYRVLGPEGDTIVSRIEKCSSKTELAEMAATCRDTMVGIGKRKTADDFELKIRQLLA